MRPHKPSSRRGSRVALMGLVALVGVLPLLGEEAERRTVRIGVLVDGDLGTERNLIGPASQARFLDAVRTEVVSLTRSGFDVVFPRDDVVAAHWTKEGLNEGLDRLLADPGVDLVLALGVLSTQVACTRRDLPKPVFAPFGVDAQLQTLPRQGEGSGVRNLNYLTAPVNLIEDLEAFQKLIGFDRVHVIHDPLVAEIIPNMYEYVQSRTETAGFEAVPAPAVDSAGRALAALPPDAEAVYITPLIRMSHDEFDSLVEGLVERKLPSFSMLGRLEVERGVLASTARETNLTRLARRVALNIHRTLLGEDPGTLPVDVDSPGRLLINMATARKIGWYPGWRTAIEAELLNDAGVEPSRGLTLSQAVAEAVAANLDLEAERDAVAAGEESVRAARAALLPQADLSAVGVRIDEDRAAASLGSQAEQTTAGSVSLTQILYSDKARAGFQIEKRLQDSREAGFDAARLDIALDTASAFLNLLRAQTLERIERGNQRLTESHLELARRRHALGASGPAETYRWESELAADKRSVLEAAARVRSARAGLNRLLHRPQEERIAAVEPSLAGSDLVAGDPRLLPHIDNEHTFTVFREFLVEEGLRDAPELKALDSAIQAQERVLLASKRAFWAPNLSLRGEIGRRFTESGEGSDPLAFPSPPFPPGLPPQADDTDWSVSVLLGVPLYTGGGRPAEMARASLTLSQLRREREAAAERIELRIRATLFETGSSYPAIELAAESAEAAKKNLDLVSDMYAQGVVSIIDLLDAQNASLVAEQASANSVYDFLLDLMEVERAASNLDFFSSAEKRDAWFSRLREFAERAEEAGGPSP